MSTEAKNKELETLSKDLESLKKDPKEVFRAFKNLLEESQNLKQKITSLTDKNNDLETQVSKKEEKIIFLSDENNHLRDMIKKRNMQLFASKSEKLVDQLPLFSEPKPQDDLLSQDEGAVEKIEEAAIPSNRSPKKKKPYRGKAIDPSLERRDIVIDVKDSLKKCSCGCEKVLMGEEVSEKLEMIPAKLIVNRYRRLKYVCKSCEEGVVITPAKKSIIPGGMAEASLLAHIITAKYVDHIPLYRQEDVLGRIGIDLSRGTLCHWVLRVGEELKPLYDHLCKKIIGSDYIQADETTLQVLKEKDRRPESKSYMWMYKEGITPYVVYEYQTTRGGEHPKKFLKNFKGCLQTDEWNAYKGCGKEVQWVKCWAHARRKFHEVYKLSHKKKGVAYEMLALIGKLYKIERECAEKNLSYEGTQKARKKDATPVLKAIKKILDEKTDQAPPHSGIGNALKYTLRNWDGLTYYINNGRIKIDNNAAERCIKPFVIGRKNWLCVSRRRNHDVKDIIP